MLRYGITFEDIETLDEHILSISEEEIIVKNSIYGLTENQLSTIKRYI
jgi:ATP-dependent RNA helicase DOB1